jgi:hypothetical protein
MKKKIIQQKPMDKVLWNRNPVPHQGLKIYILLAKKFHQCVKPEKLT